MIRSANPVVCCHISGPSPWPSPGNSSAYSGTFSRISRRRPRVALRRYRPSESATCGQRSQVFGYAATSAGAAREAEAARPGVWLGSRHATRCAISRVRGTPRHLAGDDKLAYRVAQELTTRYRERVTVILASKRQNHGPEIDRLPGVRVIERDELDQPGVRRRPDHLGPGAGPAAPGRRGQLSRGAARAGAEPGHPARARRGLQPGPRGPGARVLPRLRRAGRTAMSAPSFAAAALGEPAPSHVRVSGRTLYVARREDADPNQVLCGLGRLQHLQRAPAAAPGRAERRSGAGRRRRDAARPAGPPA